MSLNESVFGEVIGNSLVVSDDDVGEHLTFSDSPQFNTKTTNVQEVVRVQILEEFGVGDLTSLPNAFVSGVGNTRSNPFALVGGVGNAGRLPFAATDCFALRVGNSNSFPFTVFFVAPVSRLLGLRVRNFSGFVVQPAFGLLVVGVVNLGGCVFVPVVGLLGVRVGNASKKVSTLFTCDSYNSSTYVSSSTQSAGLESVGSSISLGGLTGGLNEVSKVPFLTSSRSMYKKTVLSLRISRVYK